MFMTCHVKKSINISDYGNILACGAIYSQNVVLKTFLISNDTIATWQHLVAKYELFGLLWFDPATLIYCFDCFESAMKFISNHIDFLDCFEVLAKNYFDLIWNVKLWTCPSQFIYLHIGPKLHATKDIYFVAKSIYL